MKIFVFHGVFNLAAEKIYLKPAKLEKIAY